MSMNREMAEMGIQEFIISLAYDLEFGFGSEKQNTKEAIKWYKRAGDKESLERARELEDILKGDDIKC